MEKLPYTLRENGTAVDADGSKMGDIVEGLKVRFKALLEPDQAQVMDLLIEISEAVEAMEYGYLTEHGFDCFFEDATKADNQITDLECLVELTPEAYARLEERLAEERFMDPDLTIEDLLSKLILAIPMPN